MLSIKSGKSGAKMQGIQPEMYFAAAIADQVYESYGVKNCVVTEGTGGVHKSIVHYLGYAIDIRTNNIMRGKPQHERVVFINRIRDEIQRRLGDEYQVIFEEKKVHMHMEFDPR